MEQQSWLNSPLGLLSWDGLPALLLLLVPIWLLGTLTGLMLPRPKWSHSLTLSTLAPSVYGIRHALLACHGFLILRELWYKIAEPGTIRRLCKAIVLWLFGQGWTFDFPSSARPGVPHPPADADANNVDKWYVGRTDLEFFRYHAEGSGALPGASPWEVIMEKDIPNFCKYTSWRRVLPSGKTEYKSVTISPDATAEEFIDLYFDDAFRPTWDSMIIEHEVVEHGDFAQRQQVVRWTRRFPFGFISDRQYTIARRLFREGQDLYGITKGVKHPSCATDLGVVQVDVFYSMWRSRTIPCPWGSDAPAVETLLLHHEQLKIPENLARFAVRHGMWNFVKCAADNMPGFIAARRARGVLPSQPDPDAFGSGFLPNPPSSVPPSGGSFSSSRVSSAGSDEDRDEVSEDAPKRSSSNAKKLRGLAAFAIAGSLALLMGGGTSSTRASRVLLDPEGPDPRPSLPGKWVPSGKPGAGGGGGGGRMRRSVSVASALDSRRKRQQQYRFMQDPLVYWEEPVTE